MNSFIRGLGGGIGRAIGRILGLIIVAILGFLLITYLDIDIKSVIRNTLFLNAKAMEQTSDITNAIRTDTTVCNTSGGNGSYCVDGLITRQVKTTYNGRAQCIGFAFDYYFMSNRDYTLNIIANGNDFRNNNLTYTGYSYTTYPANASVIPIQGRFINKQKIQIVIPYDAQETHSISICSNSYMTGDTNYNIKQVFLTYDDGQQDISGIVDNATQNTTDIINNNNSNAQDTQNAIFNSAASIITELADKCKNLLNLIPYDNYTLNGVTFNVSDGVITLNGTSTSNFGISFTNLMNLSQGKYILYAEFGGTKTGDNSFYLYNYQTNSSPSGGLDPNFTQQTFNLVSDISNTAFDTYITSGVTFNNYTIKPMLISGFERNGYCAFGTNISKLDWINSGLSALGYTEEQIKEIQEDIKDTQQETLDTIKDDNIDTTQSNDFFNNFQDNTHGLSGIITIPLSTIQGLATKQCSPILLPIPYTGKNITLPCLTPIYEERIPVLLTLIRTLWYGILSYYVLTDIFFMVKGFKDPDSDKIEVLDL